MQQIETTCHVHARCVCLWAVGNEVSLSLHLQGAVLGSSDRGGIRIQYSKNPFGKKRDAAGNWVNMHDGPSPAGAGGPVYGGAPYSPMAGSPMLGMPAPGEVPQEAPPQAAYPGPPAGYDGSAHAAAESAPQPEEPKLEAAPEQQGYDPAQAQLSAAAAEAAPLANGAPADAGGGNCVSLSGCGRCADKLHT